MIEPTALQTMLLMLTSAVGAEAGEAVPQWRPVDFVFASATPHENPFTVRLAAEVVGPDSTRTVPGFYNGDGRFVVRVSPTAVGAWTLSTQSDDPELDGREVSFECVPCDNDRIHGGLRVDPESPHHFVWEDGARYFPLGYECDWLWALDMGDPALPTMAPFLDELSRVGFNHIITNAYAHDTSWRRGTTGPDDFGPPPMFAWEGTNERPDHSRMNLAYWQHYDRMLHALLERGIVAHIMIKVYNKFVQWPAPGSAEDDLFFGWMVARYAAFPNVVWDFSKEANNEPSLDYKLDRLAFLRHEDPYQRLLTVHDDHATYDSGAYDDVLDFRSDQQHGDWHATILEHRAQRAWPVVNVEFGYEHGPAGPNDATYGVVQPPEEVTRRAWEILMAGGHIAYYYTYTAWDVIRPEDRPVCHETLRHLRELMEGTHYWLMAPSDELVSAGHCLALPGREYVVHLDQAAPFTLDLSAATEPLRVEWLDPLTGRRYYTGALDPGIANLTPPDELLGKQAVLHTAH